MADSESTKHASNSYNLSEEISLYLLLNNIDFVTDNNWVEILNTNLKIYNTKVNWNACEVSL